MPRPDLVRPVAAGLADLTPREATSPDIVRARLPVSRAVLGPAALFYPPAGFKAHRISGVEEACRGDVEDLVTSASPDELDESGVHEITGPLFISRASTGEVAAACGYRCWPNHVAHLSVLTHSTHRREGHARRAAETAISHAIAEHLLPQWRARPEGSRALARRLGLVELGAQLSLEPA